MHFFKTRTILQKTVMRYAPDLATVQMPEDHIGGKFLMGAPPRALETGKCAFLPLSSKQSEYKGRATAICTRVALEGD